MRLAMASSASIKEGVKVYENAMKTGTYCNWILRDGAWVGGENPRRFLFLRKAWEITLKTVDMQCR